MFSRSTSPSASKTSEQKGEETSRERADSSQQSPRQSVIVPVIFALVVVGNRNFAFKSGSSQFWVEVFWGPPDPCPETIRNMSGTSLQSGSIKKKRRLERRILRKRKPGARQVDSMFLLVSQLFLIKLPLLMRAVKFKIIGSLLCSSFPRDGIASDRKVGL